MTEADTPSSRIEAREEARRLFEAGWSVPEIARKSGLKAPTLYRWRRADGWQKRTRLDEAYDTAQDRLLALIVKDEKTDADYRELEELSKLTDKLLKQKRFAQGGKEALVNDRIADRDAKRDRGRARKKEEKNRLTEEQVQTLVAAFLDLLFDYQKLWHRARDSARIRNVVKSRQIGATLYFALEALIDAITTGDNQIFLSASRAQANVFREYMITFVREHTGVDLVGSPIVLWNGATLYFLGTNSKTAQSYHGHVYIDEYAWIGRFLEFRKVASAMATHKKWRQTYFSTPSVITHESHAFWTGEHFNKGRPKAQRIEIDVSHEALKGGRVCEDGQWRHLITIEDAITQGADKLFDYDQLRLEYNDHDFANLFGGEWVDDSAAYFAFEELRRCMVDSWDAWAEDFRPHDPRPYAGPVWIGYDPSLGGDNASIAVLAPPLVEGGRFRLLETESHADADFHDQAAAIRRLTEKYNTAYIGIDTTQIGEGVYELVRKFFPAAVKIKYSVEVKARMVHKAKHLIRRRLFEFDAGRLDVCTAFMAIRKTMTGSGRHSTFQAQRGRDHGHADVAWAIMHAFDRLHFTDFEDEDTTGAKAGGGRNIVEIMG